MMRPNGNATPSSDGSDLVWQGEAYARIPPGVYQASCNGWQGPEWLFAYQRWSLRLNFALLDAETEVSAFLNMGSNPKRKSFGRQSKFYKAWCQANGEAPHKGQRLAYSTFTQPGLLYTLRIADAIKDGHQEDKPDVLVYSKVLDILRVERP